MNKQNMDFTTSLSIRGLCILVLSLPLALLQQDLAAQTNAETRVDTKIFIFEGGTPNSRARVAGYLSSVIEAMNKVTAKEATSIDAIRHLCTDIGFESLKKLVAKDSVYSTLSEMVGKIVIAPSRSDFEVRDIRVNLGKRSLNRDYLPFKYLIFTFDKNEKIKLVEYEKSEHNRLIDTGLNLSDEDEKRAIDNFIESYEKAYNERDSTFIDTTLSNSALIIVGRDLRPSQDKKYSLEKDTRLSQRDLQLIVKDKKTYISDLKRKVFRRAQNIDIKLRIDSITIHEKYRNIVGVNLYQVWNSTFYNDKGHLFLMFDFQNKQNPVIYVRSFQFHPFRIGDLKGQVIQLSSFNL